MHIHGLQKLAMVDYPGKLAATVFTGGCNLRCPFCHNALLVTRLAETPRSLSRRCWTSWPPAGALDGVVLTGGEPLFQPDAADFLRKVRELGFAVKLDTNGCDPARLAEILNQGLVDYVAMDVKKAPARYAETVGIPGFNPAPVEESIRLLRKGTVDYEFRTTLVRELPGRRTWTPSPPGWQGRPVLSSELCGLRQSDRPGISRLYSRAAAGLCGRVRPFFGAVELRGID